MKRDTAQIKWMAGALLVLTVLGQLTVLVRLTELDAEVAVIAAWVH